MTVEGPIRTYKVKPTVVTEEHGGKKNAVITRLDFYTVKPSETMLTATASELAMRNMNWMETTDLMHRMGDLHQNPPRENGFWTRFSRGKLDAHSSYDNDFSQGYNQIYVGYDRKDYMKNGQTYSGIAVGHLYGDVNYSNGSGTVSSTSVSFYNTWIRDDGHYLDVIAKAGKLRSDYQILGYGSANYDTPDYSLSAEYGYKKELSRDYFIEPQFQLSLQRMDSATYHTTNRITVYQNGLDNLVGRVGIRAGRDFSDGSNIYMNLAYLSTFAGTGGVKGYHSDDELNIATAGNGSWVEMTVGTNWNMSKDSNFYFDLTKTFGGTVTQKWQINSGLRWAF